MGNKISNTNDLMYNLSPSPSMKFSSSASMKPSPSSNKSPSPSVEIKEDIKTNIETKENIKYLDLIQLDLTTKTIT